MARLNCGPDYEAYYTAIPIEKNGLDTQSVLNNRYNRKVALKELSRIQFSDRLKDWFFNKKHSPSLEYLEQLQITSMLFPEERRMNLSDSPPSFYALNVGKQEGGGVIDYGTLLVDLGSMLIVLYFSISD